MYQLLLILSNYLEKRNISLDNTQWRIQRVLDAGIPVWVPKLCAQIIEKCLKESFLIQALIVKTFVANISRFIKTHIKL